MKTRAALALSVAGVLLTGSAAFATTQSLSNTGTGTSDDARNVLVTDDSATRTSAPAVSSADATPKSAAKSSDDTQADDKKASAAKKASKAAEAVPIPFSIYDIITEAFIVGYRESPHVSLPFVHRTCLGAAFKTGDR